MPVINRIASYADDLTALRQEFHEHPEIGFQEVRTSAKVASLLAGWGIAVTRGQRRQPKSSKWLQLSKARSWWFISIALPATSL